MSDDALHFSCFVCQRRKKFGNHVYEGKPVQAWGGVMICHACREANSDGIARTTYPHVLNHLEKHGIVVKYNAKGWIDIPA